MRKWVRGGADSDAIRPGDRDARSGPGPAARFRSARRPTAALAFSPDGKWLASGGDKEWRTGKSNTVRVWEVATGKARPALGRHETVAKALRFSPASQTLAAGGAGKVRVRRMDTRKAARPLTQLEGCNYWSDAIAFSPDAQAQQPAGLESR